MGSSLIDVFIDKLRIIALQKLTMGYLATNIDLGYLSNLLAFDDATQCEKFLLDQGKSIITSLTLFPGCQFTSSDNKRLDCKASLMPLKKAPLRVRRCKK
jgi:hypothetical protein